MTSRRLILTFFASALLIQFSYAYVCTSDYCTKNPCTVDTNCQSKNNSRIIKNGGACGCCDLCILQLSLGDLCNPILVAFPSSECGAGLTCSPEGTCIYRLQSECTREQVNYDEIRANGTILPGKQRPICDYWGYYDAVRCIAGSVCFCVNKIGERIFGTDFIGHQKSMMCNCSRDADFLQQSLATTQAFIYDSVDYSSPPPFAHCLPNGNYDPLQCVNGNCFCLSKDLKLDSAISSESIKETLICYDPEYHNENYLRECEKVKSEIQSSLTNYTEVYGADVPQCDLDGSYGPVQCVEDSCFCAHKVNGSQIEDFKVTRYSDDAKQMKCYCARDRLHVTDPILRTQYRCDYKGDYEPIQCQGNLCYCVDESGMQVGPEINRIELQSLNCTVVLNEYLI